MIHDDIVFKNRDDAGRKLGQLLKTRYKSLDPLILGVPRGGLIVACHVANALHAQLDIVISRKLSLPGFAEVGFGAIAEDLSVCIPEQNRTRLAPETIGAIIDSQTDEVNRRVQDYRKNKPLTDMKGRVVIIVDDGIATGVTLVPILRMCRRKGASKIIIAAPVAGSKFDQSLNDADALEILFRPEYFYAVSQVYSLFESLSEQEMLARIHRLPDCGRW